MAYEMRLSGPNICKQDTIYPYEAIMKRENDDKKKGNLKELKYEWFLPGFIPEKADEKTPIAKVRTPKVEAFSPDPKNGPKPQQHVMAKLFGREDQYKKSKHLTE